MTPRAKTPAPAATILVADDDPDLREILRTILASAGFRVLEAPDGTQALELIRRQAPDLILLDYMMPELTGPEVCEQIKTDLLLRHLPVIMLTGKGELQDKVAGITAGADDYVVKPFEPTELLARVTMVLRRTARDLDANPLTKLPGNITIQQELERRLAAGGPMAVCYADLDRFKAFNDHYGFGRGDDVIRETARLLLEAARTHGGPQDFVGHIGGDDFLLITTPDRVDALCGAIVQRFDDAVPRWYDEVDRARGHLLHADRKGKPVRVPFLAISIAVVTNEQQPFTHPGEIVKIGAELKTLAKQTEGSLYVKERRKPA